MIVDHIVRMEPKDRLRQAMREKGFEKPTDAWRAHQRELGISQDLVISNANGNRPISRKSAEIYARVFGHEPGWYLYGEEETPRAASKKGVHLRVVETAPEHRIDQELLAKILHLIALTEQEERRLFNPELKALVTSELYTKWTMLKTVPATSKDEDLGAAVRRALLSRSA